MILIKEVKMDILILGGTGAMGQYITNILVEKGFNVSVTSRKKRISENEKIEYVHGNAMEENFLYDITGRQKWDCVIDFMTYDTLTLQKRLKILLECTKQYIFISSARVYADSAMPLTEDSPRLLDTCADKEYLSTEEYALAKARQENLLFESEYKNWTIIRPSLTYSDKRLQLGVYEKENWLRRALKGRSIVFSEDLMDRCYTMSWGNDVAQCIAETVCCESAIGQIYNPVLSDAVKWSKVLEIYCDILEKHTGKKPKVKIVKKCTNLKVSYAKYQVLYGRYFNRYFDNSKLKEIVDTSGWIKTEDGLRKCLSDFLKAPSFLPVDYVKEAYIDRAAHEFTPLSEILSKRDKIQYMCYRFRVPLLWNIILKISRLK